MHPLRKQRLYVVLSILLGTSISALLVFMGLSKSINLFYSPSEILKEHIDEGTEIRVGGMVKKGSVYRETNSLKVSFKITDFQDDLIIEYEGILPDLFSEETGVVLQGSINSRGVFVAHEVLAKHDENYMPPEVAASLKKSAEK